MGEFKNKPLTWEALPFPELVVGEATKGFHTDDTVYWCFKGSKGLKFANKKIYSVGHDGIIYLGKSLLPFGNVVKIDCPHKK
ncbi:MAG: hypothetical protein NUV87_04545 [Candidatus Roizmanbacteria bacterium]|nr:hypothetical protein [Candidatus Roizmanbacteria bacterium]